MDSDKQSGSCTWLSKKNGSCQKTAVKPQASKDGSIWAELCEHHEGELIKAIQSGNPLAVMGCYVAAQGGPNVAARRTVDQMFGR